jgi:hypothetical protein
MGRRYARQPYAAIHPSSDIRPVTVYDIDVITVIAPSRGSASQRTSPACELSTPRLLAHETRLANQDDPRHFLTLARLALIDVIVSMHGKVASRLSVFATGAGYCDCRQHLMSEVQS